MIRSLNFLEQIIIRTIDAKCSVDGGSERSEQLGRENMDSVKEYLSHYGWNVGRHIDGESALGEVLEGN